MFGPMPLSSQTAVIQHNVPLDALRLIGRCSIGSSPLLAYGNRGITPARRDPGWLEFFLATGVHGELLRGIVLLDAPGVAQRLVPHLRSAAGVEHGHAVIRRVVHGLFDGGPVADEILRHVAVAAASQGLR